jgi:hypothetical protein
VVPTVYLVVRAEAMRKTLWNSRKHYPGVRRRRNVRRVGVRPESCSRSRGVCEGHNGRPRRRRALYPARAAPGAARGTLYESDTLGFRAGGAAAAYLVVNVK